MNHPEVREVKQGDPIGFVPVYAPEKPAAPAPVAAPIPGKALALLGVALVFGGLGAYFVATSADRAQLAAERNRANLAEQRATIAEQEVNRVRACVLGGGS